MTQEWRTLNDEEVYALYSSPKIIRVKKSKRMRWTGHVAFMEERISSHRVPVGRSERKNHLEYLSTDGRIILKWIFNKWNMKAWIRLIWQGKIAGACKCGMNLQVP
jgi:hypothetical protein